MFIQKGPYLQNPQKDSIVFMWETSEEASSEVRIYDTYHAHLPKDAKPIIGEPRIVRGEAGTLHKVQADGLKSGTDYYYEVVSENDRGRIVSDACSFRTAPEEDTAFSFVLTAEYGGTGEASYPYVADIVERIRRERPDFIQSVGDILRDGTRDVDWDVRLFAPFRKLIHSTPFYPCVGNHEVGSSTIPDQEIASHYRNYEKYFAFPRNYSFDYGCAHFCVLDCPSMFERVYRSETDKFIMELKADFENSEAYRFLEKDLSESTAAWKFVIFHYPPYTSAIWDARELRILAPLFEKYKVDVVFNSHAIVYERSHPIKGGKLDRNGVRYILVGGYADFDGWFRDKSNGLSAKISARPNYVRVAITPWSMELQAIDYEGKLFDCLKLEK